MDVQLAIASKRDTRRYGEAALPAETEDRILDAGRLAGSARNRQPWRFVVVADEGERERVAAAVHAPTNASEPRSSWRSSHRAGAAGSTPVGRPRT
ncbi:MAG: nitroreductase family protein [Thermoleophilia bacterium]